MTVVMQCTCGVPFDRGEFGSWTKNCECPHQHYQCNLTPILSDSILFKQLTDKVFVSNQNGMFTYKNNLNQY